MRLLLVCMLLCLNICISSFSAQAATTQISLQLKWKHQFQFAGYYMALEKGYYKDAGLDVKLIEGGAGQSATQYVLENHNAYAVTDTGALLAHANGKPVRAIGAIFQHSPLALMVLEKAAINTLADLRGKRIMLQNGYQGADMLAMLNVGADLTTRDFTLQVSSFEIKDLIKSNTDAFSVYLTNALNYMEMHHIPYRIFKPEDHGIDFYGDILITSNQEVSNHPARVDAFMQATVRGWHDALTHTEEAIDLILLKYNTQHLSRQLFQFEARESARLMMADVVKIGYMNTDRWQHIASIYADQNLMPANYPVSSFIYQPEPDVLTVLKHHLWEFAIAVLLLALLIAGIIIFTLKKTVQASISKLSESERNLRNLIELADFGILVHRHGRVLFANAYLLTLVGVSSMDEVQGEMILEFVHPDDRPDVADRVQKVIADGTVFHRMPVRQISRSGEQHDVEVSAMPIHYEGETAVLSVFLDVTDRKRIESEKEQMQRQVEHTQRLESLGVLAGGIAHDFNNLLSVILGHAGMAIGKVNKDPDAVFTHLERVIQSGENAAVLCKQMLAYSGKGHFVIEPVDLSHLLREMTELLEVSIEKEVRITYRFPDRLPLIEADLAQMQQVMMNLIINASEAIVTQSGTIDVRCGVMKEVDNGYLAGCIHDGAVAGDFVYIEVTDNGCGMDAATIDKIFDPFFTTKFTGRGLGMSAMMGIVRGHYGAIHIDSSVGKGTAIKVLLPSLHRYAEVKTAPHLTGHESQGENETPQPQSGTVLVVDDEPSILEMATAMLEDLGFQVLTAMNGKEAVAAYRETMSQARPVLFVLLDLTMPVMNGEQAFSELLVIDPDVQVVISSGYAEDDVLERFKGRKLCGFIQKPYMPDAFEKIIMQANKQSMRRI